MKPLQRAILRTLAYHSLFDYPLTRSEIRKFLIEKQSSKKQILKALSGLVENKKINKQGNYYFLPNKKETIILRKRRELYSGKKILIAKKIAKLLQVIPWIKMLAITGALAMNNSNKQDDIDFLIITSQNRLWLTRLLMVVYLELLGKRRRPKERETKNKICLNMFLAENFLKLPKEKQNLFTAHEIVQMKPILDKDNTYKKFILKNLWVKKYIPNGVVIELSDKGTVDEKQKSKRVFNYLEKFVFRLQLNYMKSKRTKEQISHHYAFFHPEDRSDRIIKEYEESKTVAAIGK